MKFKVREDDFAPSVKITDVDGDALVVRAVHSAYAFMVVMPESGSSDVVGLTRKKARKLANAILAELDATESLGEV